MIEARESWEIRPFECAGPVQFGMKRSVVRSILGGDFVVFRKSPTSTSDTDDFGGVGHFYYNDEDQLDYMEIFGKRAVCFRGVELIGRVVDEVLRDLLRIGLTPRRDGDAVFVDDAGFALIISEDGAAVDGVSVFERNYYGVVE